ncbi:MAG: hypothetical protein COB98_08185 [Flavobacteriaceae bacterium]|nr:MAG: hypothetical protein COB98_08185 [Flavobacteriaceae bacterium]
MKKISIILFLFFGLDAVAQCAMCKAVIESGNPEMAEGINSGIMYLMVFPYILVGVLLYVLYKYMRKSKN